MDYLFRGIGTFIMLLLIVGMLLFVPYTLCQIATNRNLANREKGLWVLVVFFLNIFGAIMYYLIGQPRKTRR